MKAVLSDSISEGGSKTGIKVRPVMDKNDKDNALMQNITAKAERVHYKLKEVA